MPQLPLYYAEFASFVEENACMQMPDSVKAEWLDARSFAYRFHKM
jgi:hypothetical protein